MSQKGKSALNPADNSLHLASQTYLRILLAGGCLSAAAGLSKTPIPVTADVVCNFFVFILAAQICGHGT